MSTSLGKQVRLHRLQNPQSGRILTIAIDHAPSYGVLPGLEDIQAVIDRVAAGGPDAVMLMKGPAQRCFAPYAGDISLILKSSTLSPFHPTQDVWVNPVEDALRLGADAISMALTVGSEQQAALVSNLAALVREAEQVGLPVIVHAYPNGELVPPDQIYSAEQVSYAARLGMELGVDIVKTFYTGSAESFGTVVEAAAPALVVAAGGPRLDSDADVLTMAFAVKEAGAAGLTFGRNVWQSDSAPSTIRALAAVLHEEASVDEALALLPSQESV
ncbi:MAG: fructose-bisphosphate aldolase [Chloroflexota bacterium]|nr:fructose-bisphosphate aldolase [Chloroflexota bacterium]